VGPILKRALTLIIITVFASCLLGANVAKDDIMKAPGVRAVGMGGAFTAVADDYSSFFWNPAGLVTLDTGGASLFFDSAFAGSQLDFGVNYIYPFFPDMTAAATYLKTIYMDSKFVDDEMYISYSTWLHENRSASFGANFKIIGVSMSGENTNAGATSFDAGFMMFPDFLDGKMKFGLMAQDLDAVLSWNNGVQERIPVFYKAGASYRIDKTAIADIDLGFLDYGHERTPRMAVNIGGEKWFLNRIIGNFGLRAGWQWREGLDPNSKFGIGLSYGRQEFTVNYAFMPGINNLGDTHKIDISYFIGQKPGVPMENKPVAAATPAGEAAEGGLELMVEKFKPMQFDISAKYLSPNKDGIMDTVGLLLKGGPSRAKGVSWKISVADAAGKAVREIKGLEIVQNSVAWDGTDDSGQTVKDGDYTVTYAFTMDSKPVWTKARVVTVDTVPPEFSEFITPKTFAPGKRGAAAKLEVRIEPKYRDIKDWKLFIRNKQGSAIRKMSGEGFTGRIFWEGDDALGNTVRDGDYEVVVDVSDFAGNVFEQSEPLTVDTYVAKFGVDAETRVFKAGTDKVALISNQKDMDRIRTWDLEIRDGSGALVKAYRNKSPSVKLIIWNGTNDRNARVKQGAVYTYRTIIMQKNGIETQKEGIIQSLPPDFEGVGIQLTLAALDFPDASKEIPAGEFGYLNQAAEAVKKYAKSYYVIIKGYSTDTEDPDKNLKLSIDRMLAVRDYLVNSQGVPETNVYTTGYGDGTYTGVNKEEIAKNGRRVEVELLTK
jgi:outer membrane protein OmpA-like peptidoglycan-associated protein